MKKKGVIFVAILIVIILSLIFYFGNTKKFDLTERFNLQGKIVGYGVYENKEGIIEEFSRIYAEGLKKGEKTYIVLGNRDEVQLSTYEEMIQGKIDLLIGEKSEQLELKENKYSLTKIIPQNNKVDIVINGKNYKFNLKEGENIYFIIREEIK